MQSQFIPTCIDQTPFAQSHMDRSGGRVRRCTSGRWRPETIPAVSGRLPAPRPKLFTACASMRFEICFGPQCCVPCNGCRQARSDYARKPEPGMTSPVTYRSESAVLPNRSFPRHRHNIFIHITAANHSKLVKRSDIFTKFF